MTLDAKILTVLKDFIPDERNRLHVYAIISELIKQYGKPSPTEKREECDTAILHECSKGIWDGKIHFQRPKREDSKWEDGFMSKFTFKQRPDDMGSWRSDIYPSQVKSFISDLLSEQEKRIRSEYE